MLRTSGHLVRSAHSRRVAAAPSSSIGIARTRLSLIEKIHRQIDGFDNPLGVRCLKPADVELPACPFREEEHSRCAA